MPYRESTEDPRIDAVRRAHTVAEQGEVRRVVRRFEDELERANSALAETNARLYRAQQGTSGWLFRAPPDPAEIERELRELQSCKDTRAVAEVALHTARAREHALAERLARSPADPVSTELVVVNSALAASVRAAAAHGREVRKFMRQTVDCVMQAHRDEMMTALTGEVDRVHALPLADRAVAVARCRVDLLRANLLALGASMQAHCTALGEVLARLEVAGHGPGQTWKDQVIATAQQLDDIVTNVERSL